MTSNQEGSNAIIVGIDFGTTYSGVAFTWSNKIDKIEVITSWSADHHSNADMEKAPTTIAYCDKNSFSWGYAIRANDDQLKWFKLLLIDEDDLPDGVRTSKKIKESHKFLKDNNKTSVEMISLYLRHLWSHATARIVNTLGRTLVNYSKYHVVITLPAIWPEYAQARMREAATRAGILTTDRIGGATELSFVSEPEAAALATLYDMDGRCDIKKGDTFVVVDCGGGTADLISYQMTHISPMSVEECVKGQGDLCGGVFVDEAFAKVLKDRFGSRRWKKMRADSRYRLLNDEWEHGIKIQFDGGHREWQIAMPFECIDNKDIRAGMGAPKIIITSEDVKGAFNPVIEKISAMVDSQVAAVQTKTGKDPKYVILVGGFGRSRYLFQYLRDRLAKDIELLQSRGSAPWTAICRGAVIYASLDSSPNFLVQVAKRVSRASYGVILNETWDPEDHKDIDKAWSEEEQEWKAENQMSWFLKNGDPITADKRVKFSCFQLFEIDGASSEDTSVEIYTSSAPRAPKRANKKVRKLCIVKWDNDIEVTRLPTYVNPLGKIFYQLEYDVEMTIVGGFLDFAVYHDGKRQESRHVIVDYI